MKHTQRHAAMLGFLLLVTSGPGATDDPRVSEPRQGQEAQLTFKVTDLSTRAPLPGANVRVMDPERAPLGDGITDGVGLFRQGGLTAGVTVTVEFELEDYVNRPETRRVALKPGPNADEGRLLARTGDQAYFQRAGEEIVRLASRARSEDESRQIAEAEWKKVEQLRVEDQITVAGAISERDRRWFARLEPFNQGSESKSIIGTWTLNVEKSQFISGPTAKSATVTFEVAGPGIRVVSEIVDAEGAKARTEFTASYDGKAHPIKGSPVSDMVWLKKIDANTSERIDLMKGKVVQTSTRRVSADGKTMTVTQKGIDARGQPVTNVLLFEKK